MKPTDLLSPNFQLFEFTTSPTADRNGIDNKPSAKEIANLKKLCNEILQPAREALGPLRINSGFRNEALNKLVKGVPTSDHRLGFAADVFPMDGDTRRLAEWVVKNCPKFDQVILEFGTPPTAAMDPLERGTRQPQAGIEGNKGRQKDRLYESSFLTDRMVDVFGGRAAPTPCLLR